MKFSFFRRNIHLILSCGFACALTIFFTIVPLLPSFPSRLFTSPAAPYNMQNYLFSQADFLYYYYDAQWIVSDDVDFGELIHGYPVLATFVFSLPFALPVVEAPLMYIAVFRLFLGLFFILALMLSSFFLRELGKRQGLLWLFFLPASVYLLFGRFDIVIVSLTLLAFFFFYRQWYALSFGLFAFLTLLKWYPVFFVPVLVVYILLRTQNQKYRFTTHPLFASLLSFFGVIVIPHLVAVFFFSPQELLAPYIFQFSRAGELGGFFTVLFGGFHYLSDISVPGLFHPPLILWLIFLGTFSVLQFVPFIFLLRSVKVPSFFSVIAWCAFILLTFSFFAKFYSVQWMLWFAPFVFLLFHRYYDIILWVMYDILSYLQVPLGTDLSFWYGDWAYQLVVGIRSLLLLYFLVLAFRAIVDASDSHNAALPLMPSAVRTSARFRSKS